jgi:ADP-ribosylglycohydrolase
VYGDVLGALVEYWKPDEIRRVFGEYCGLPWSVPLDAIVRELGEHRLDGVRPLGVHADDRQQALTLLRVARSAPGWGEAH